MEQRIHGANRKRNKSYYTYKEDGRVCRDLVDKHKRVAADKTKFEVLAYTGNTKRQVSKMIFEQSDDLPYATGPMREVHEVAV